MTESRGIPIRSTCAECNTELTNGLCGHCLHVSIAAQREECGVVDYRPAREFFVVLGFGVLSVAVVALALTGGVTVAHLVWTYLNQR